ncbi:MAG: hypothetical protein A4E69_00177 [Syntrophus sp. PtaB.Bin138]|nr:MAG: hypothetical protein A4E69_00177 [Syntrophus sp. PtaB.Bin138]
MRKFGLLLIVVAMLAFPLCATAGIIGNVDLKASPSYPPNGYAYFSYPTGYNNWVLDYHVSINDGPWSEAFCVEGQDLTTAEVQYTLLTIDASLSTFGLTALNFLEAAAVADYFRNNYFNNNNYKAGAQLAVWESIFDTDFDLTAGAFRASNEYSDEAVLIWDAVKYNIPAYSNTWALAVNPTIVSGQTVGNTPFQNYLVYNPVPIPGAIWLLGSGLLGLVAVRRRRK